MNKKVKHYVNNKDFYEALKVYHKDCARNKRIGQPLPTIPNYIGVCIDMISKKLALRGNFIRYTFIEECIGDAIENMIAAVDNFDPRRFNNPFAYFTSIAWNAFLRRIEKETAQNYTKHKNMENLFVLSDEFYAELGSPVSNTYDRQQAASSAQTDGLQKHYQVIRSFEEKQSRKKEKNRAAALKKKRGTTSKSNVRKNKLRKVKKSSSLRSR